MLGTAAYIAQIHHSMRGQSGPWQGGRSPIEVLSESRNSLSAIARRIALYDVTSIFDPRPQREDRGRTLENTWKDFLPQRFGELKQFEEDGQLPSIVFAPMFIEDGRRLLISNLDLEFLTTTPGPILLNRDSLVKYGEHLSQGSLELRTLFSEEDFLTSSCVPRSAECVVPLYLPGGKFTDRPTPPSGRCGLLR